MPEEPQGEVFEGRSSEMKTETPWLASEDIMDLGDVTVTIANVHRYKNVSFDEGRVKEVVYALEFEGKKKKLVLNSTNRRCIVDKFGVNVKDWKGKKVNLYVNKNVRMMGKKVCGIRIRP